MPAASTAPEDWTDEQKRVVERLDVIRIDIGNAERVLAEQYAERLEWFANGITEGLTAKALGDVAGVSGVAVTKALKKAGRA